MSTVGTTDQNDVFFFTYEKKIFNQDEKELHTVGWNIPDTEKGKNELEAIVFNNPQDTWNEVLSDKVHTKYKFQLNNFVHPETKTFNPAILVKNADGSLKSMLFLEKEYAPIAALTAWPASFSMKIKFMSLKG